ncbi:helix-turn-helix domain-containing protein [Streptomyces sp. NPDC058685]|uniref:helix-turn-helix domain-containing protein n=1 Tax=Streptomyces sp. NPDC058685 TaxID=3346598 RepID=UPI00366790EB
MSTPRESDTEAFAQRLREIRDASGRSYGALARRVGVSASTLHRYCSGSTVPVEFAPVERLARLCGCGGEDLIALHRLWVRADADRRRRMESGGGRADAGDPHGTSGLAATSEASDTSEAPATSDTSEASEAPATSGISKASGTSKASGNPASGAPVPAAPAEDARVGIPVPGGLPDGDRVSAHRPRQAAAPAAVPAWAGSGLFRRPAAYAAALVASVLALVLLMAFDQSPLSAADRQRPTAQQPGDQDTGTSQPPGDGSAPQELTTPEAAGTDSAEGEHGSGEGRSPDPRTKATRAPGGSQPRGSGTPFTWTTDQHVWQNGCSHTYLVKRGPSAVPPPPAEADAEQWARSVGAVHAGDAGVRITVQGRNDTAVVLQGIQVRVVARRAPLKADAYSMSPGCGGSITPRLFDVNLDASRPVARSVAGNDAGDAIPALSFPYKVSAKDPEILLVTGRTVTCDCDWFLELAWSSGDRSGTVRIDDHGRPFRTSGYQGRPVHEYDSGSRRWISAGSETDAETDAETEGDGGTEAGAERGAHAESGAGTQAGAGTRAGAHPSKAPVTIRAGR